MNVPSNVAYYVDTALAAGLSVNIAAILVRGTLLHEETGNCVFSGYKSLFTYYTTYTVYYITIYCIKSYCFTIVLLSLFTHIYDVFIIICNTAVLYCI